MELQKHMKLKRPKLLKQPNTNDKCNWPSWFFIQIGFKNINGDGFWKMF